MIFHCKHRVLLILLMITCAYPMEDCQLNSFNIRAFFKDHSLYSGDLSAYFLNRYLFFMPSKHQAHELTKKLYHELEGTTHQKRQTVLWHLRDMLKYDFCFGDGNYELRKALIKGVVLSGVDTNQSLYKSRQSFSNDSLGEAVRENDIGYASFLLRFGANPNAYARICFGYHPILTGALSAPMARLLIHFGASIDLQDESTNLVHCATVHGDLSLLAYYISLGININHQDIDENNNTPLHMLTKQYSYSPNREAMITLLLESGARVDIPNNDGLTAAQYAFTTVKRLKEIDMEGNFSKISLLMHLGKRISTWTFTQMEQDERSYIRFFVKDIRTLINQLLWQSDYLMAPDTMNNLQQKSC